MKPLLILSLVGNVALAGWAFYLHSREHPPLPEPVRAAAAPIVVTNTAAFHWNQVESPYYTVFIANLRAIGCPPQTIQDIIAADLKSNYDARRAGLKTNTLPPQALAQIHQVLEREEQHTRELLLASNNKSGANPKPPITARPPTPTPPAQAPVPSTALPGEPSREDLIAFFSRRETPNSPTKMMYDSLNPTEQELRELYHLSVKYDDAFGAGNPNPADTTWERRRRRAIQDMEDQLRSLIGYPRYNEYLREALIRQQNSKAAP